MSDKIELTAVVRSDMGKGASRRLRKTGLVPAVIYGGETDPISITLPHNSFMHELENEAVYSQILSLKIGNKKKEDVILRDLQRHPFKPKIMHADFMRIDHKTVLHVAIPLHLLNEETCHGVKQEGGLLNRLVNEIEVACLPKDLPEYLELDVAGLELGDSLHLSDIKVPEGVEIIALTHIDEQDPDSESEHDIGVVAVHKMREEVVDEEVEEPVEVAVVSEEATEE